MYFLEHKSSTGRAFYFWSNKAQDRNGASANRFKRLVSATWKGRVQWAGLYHNDVLLYEYKSDTGEWETK